MIHSTSGQTTYRAMHVTTRPIYQAENHCKPSRQPGLLSFSLPAAAISSHLRREAPYRRMLKHARNRGSTRCAEHPPHPSYSTTNTSLYRSHHIPILKYAHSDILYMASILTPRAYRQNLAFRLLMIAAYDASFKSPPIPPTRPAPATCRNGLGPRGVVQRSPTPASAHRALEMCSVLIRLWPDDHNRHPPADITPAVTLRARER